MNLCDSIAITEASVCAALCKNERLFWILFKGNLVIQIFNWFKRWSWRRGFRIEALKNIRRLLRSKFWNFNNQIHLQVFYARVSQWQLMAAYRKHFTINFHTVSGTHRSIRVHADPETQSSHITGCHNQKRHRNGCEFMCYYHLNLLKIYPVNHCSSVNHVILWNIPDLYIQLYLLT